MAKSKSSSLNNLHPYQKAEILRMRLNGEQSQEWETAKIIRKKHRKGQWPNVEYFETVEVIRMKKA